MWQLTYDIIDLKCHLTLHKIGLSKIKTLAPPMGQSPWHKVPTLSFGFDCTLEYTENSCIFIWESLSCCEAPSCIGWSDELDGAYVEQFCTDIQTLPTRSFRVLYVNIGVSVLLRALESCVGFGEELRSWTAWKRSLSNFVDCVEVKFVNPSVRLRLYSSDYL